VTAARAFDWGAGDVQVDEGGHYVEAEPEGERIAFTLCTQLGECGYDPTLGVDWATLDMGSPSVLREAERRVRAALERYVRRGRFTLARVECSRLGAEGLFWAVDYVVGGTVRTIKKSALRVLDRRELEEPVIENARVIETGALRVTESGEVRVWE
jgi:hypothetical protein